MCVVYANASGVPLKMLLIVDTDILIDAGRSVQEAIDFLQQNEQRATLAASAITQMELLVGARNKRELRVIERFVARFVVMKVNEVVSDKAVDLLRQYRLSHGLAIADAVIAATAIVADEPFVTKNRRDYQFIPELKLQSYP
jgi:predicted nucleic acid-binding protein